jgi:hypothetical protein
VTRRRVSVASATAAVAWSVALIAAVYLVPVYSTEDSSSTCDSSGNCVSTTASGGASLVDENGTWVLWIVAALILCAVVFWFALRRQWIVLGWTLAIAVLVLSVISFGLIVFTLPLALLMIIAAATCRGPDEQRV